MSSNGNALSTDEIIERLLATDNLPDELHGVQHKVEEYGGGRKETRLEIWERLPNEVRSEILSAETVREFDFEIELFSSTQTSHSESGEGTMVKNENGLITYDAEANQYYRYEYELPEEQSGYTTEVPFVGSTPKTDFDVTYDGSDTVAGRGTHVLTFRPTEEADSFVQWFDFITMWVDETYWFPLKHEANFQLRNEGIVQTTEENLQNETYFQKHAFEEIEFNIGFEDDRFQFDPPGDAERIE